MSSDSEDENYCFYGKSLEPYDEDSFPKKRPIAIEDQIATDSHGRRRFHGAFTGGFSAGFFNSVGSLEGWTPSEFKSTRQEKAETSIRKPEDFMDDEDRGEFGIAPETVRTTSNYSNNKKRKKQVYTNGPIPGEPVLQTLLESGNDTIGYLLLKNIGLKHGPDENESESGQKIYGCDMPEKYEISRSLPTCDIPKIYEDHLKCPKINTFGMGYSGLAKSHVNLFQSSGVSAKEKNKKSFSISGHGFGVGAFEKEDDDIYAREDMCNYDFELTTEKIEKKARPMKISNSVLDTFILSKTPLIIKLQFPLPLIPRDFTGKYKNQKNNATSNDNNEQINRNQVNSLTRSNCLEEQSPLTFSRSKDVINKPGTSKTCNQNRKIIAPLTEVVKDFSVRFAPASSNDQEQDVKKPSENVLLDRFVNAVEPDDHTDILEPVKSSETTHGTKDMRDAARMKMFGPLTRVNLTWKPCSLLCRRFNVQEPKYDDIPKRDRKRNTHLIFEHQKHSDENTLCKPGLSIKQEPEYNESEEGTSNSFNDNIENGSSLLNSNIIPEEIKQEKSSNIIESITKPVDITEKVDIVKNIDLFKAVFLDSSDDESEHGEDLTKSSEKEETQRNDMIKSNILGEVLIPKIKSAREGILSNIGFTRWDKPNHSNTMNSNNASEISDSNDSVVQQTPKFIPMQNPTVNCNAYGPKLPERIIFTKPKTIEIKNSSSEDEWVEKDKHKKKSHKHKKKHKKEKHRKKHKKSVK